ncbi:hypothetical protein [Streptomyces peucetius]|nr:hypothetical protein CGZ69_00645 [Streptomyces peucetius subsp. caesius ATCC 27952]
MREERGEGAACAAGEFGPDDVVGVRVVDSARRGRGEHAGRPLVHTDAPQFALLKAERRVRERQDHTALLGGRRS